MKEGCEEENASQQVKSPQGGPAVFPVISEVTKMSLNVISHMMDIAEPLSSLKKSLEQRLQCSLKEHEIYLQNNTLLDEQKNLLEQGVSAEGTLQFSVEVISTQGVKPRLNIVDVIRPITVALAVDHIAGTEIGDATKCKWVVCNSYREEQEKMGIPTDPKDWTKEQTIHWFHWAINEFNIESCTIPKELHLAGTELCKLTKRFFIAQLPKSAAELMWSHLELLKKYNEDVSKMRERPLRITGFGSTTSLTATETEQGITDRSSCGSFCWSS